MNSLLLQLLIALLVKLTSISVTTERTHQVRAGMMVTLLSMVTFLQDGSIASPALTFRNDFDTGLYRVGSNSLGWVVGGSRKFYTSSSRAYFQNLSEGVDVPSLRISGTTVIDSSRNIFGVQGSFQIKWL